MRLRNVIGCVDEWFWRDHWKFQERRKKHLLTKSPFIGGHPLRKRTEPESPFAPRGGITKRTVPKLPYED